MGVQYISDDAILIAKDFLFFYFLFFFNLLKGHWPRENKNVNKKKIPSGLQKLVDVFDSVSRRQKLEIDVDKGKVMYKGSKN